MEEKLLKAIEKTLKNLRKDEEQCQKELEKINNKISRGESIEEKEYKEDLKKIQKEIKEKQEDKEKATNLFKLKQEKEAKKTKFNNSKSKLLKDKEQCEEAIKQVEGKKEYKDGKLVDTKELLEYKNDLEKINAELANFENRVEKNSKEIVELEKGIADLYTKYKVKDEKEVEPKKDEDKKDKFQPPAVVEKDKFQPPAVAEKDRFQPPAVAEKDRFQPPAVIEKDKETPAVIENDENTETRKNLPIRSFWEIYNDTCTEHVGSIAHNINKMAHMKLLPNKDEDTVHKILSLPLTAFKAPMKLLAQIPNRIMGTDKKIAEMAEKIDKLSVAEFQVLVQSPEKVNEMFGKKVKEDIDRDYLDPQFMKQYKVNNAYLDVVRTRLGRERGAAIELYNAKAESAYNRMNELEKIGKENWTEEQRKEYNAEIDVYTKCVKEGKKCVAELDTFDEGAKKKSSAYRNISGWFLAKFNPDNREANEKMAKLAKARREAVEQGKGNEANEYTKKMEDELRNNTEIVGGKRNFLDRGIFSFEGPVEFLNRGQQTKGRLLLTDLAIITSAIKAFTQSRENDANNQIIEEHNNHLKQVNKANTNIKVNGEAKISDSPQASETEETIARQTIEAGWNKAERGNLSQSNWNMQDNTYIQNDLQSHAEAAQASNDAAALIGEGKHLGALKTATDYFSKVKTSSTPSTAAHVAKYTQNDYTAFEFGSEADMAKVYEFFANGTVPYTTNITATMAELLPRLQDGVDYTGVIFAGVNALYQSQKEALESKAEVKRNAKRNIREEVKVNNTSKQTRQANAEVKGNETKQVANAKANETKKVDNGER